MYVTIWKLSQEKAFELRGLGKGFLWKVGFYLGLDRRQESRDVEGHSIHGGQQWKCPELEDGVSGLRNSKETSVNGLKRMWMNGYKGILTPKRGLYILFWRW